VIPPIANLIGLAFGAAFGSTYWSFAVILTVFRFVGTGTGFMLLPYARITLGEGWRHTREASRFLTSDIFSLGSDQLTVLLNSYILTRGDLGLLGLCRQVLTVSDTPGWSKIQASYPELVRSPDDVGAALSWTMLRLGSFCGLACVVVMYPASNLVFHLHRLFSLVVIAMLCTPFRYLVLSYDFRLRAIGAIGLSNRVCAARGLLSLLIVPAAAAAAGALGAVLGASCQTGLAVWLTRRSMTLLESQSKTNQNRVVPEVGSRGLMKVDRSGLAPDEGPILSVVIPAYNVASYVEAAIDSALGQTFRALEVIVIDDGSTDSTPELLRAIEHRVSDRRLRVIHQENGGLSAARNTGIRLALGRFIGFLDADDVWRPEKAEWHVSVLERHDDVGLTFSYSEYITEEGQETRQFMMSRVAEPSLHDMIRRNHIGNGSTAVVRRECFEQAGVFAPQLRSCEDYEMWCRILWQTAYRAQLIPKPLTLYRLRQSSLSFNATSFVANADAAVARLREQMPQVPEKVFRAGHAEHYRIAARKALLAGQRRAAADLLKSAVRLRPLMFLVNARALATAAAVIAPARLSAKILGTAIGSPGGRRPGR
jgi:hypothetical protein